MSQQAPQSLRVMLSNKEGLGKISVGLEPFFDFSFSLAEQLQELVSTHQRQHGVRPLQAVGRANQRR